MKIKWDIFDILLAIGIIVMISIGVYYKLAFFEVFVGVFGIVAGLVNAKGLKIFLYTYATQSVVYGLQCVFSRQYGLAILSLGICFPLYLIQIIKQFKNKNKLNDTQDIKIKTLNLNRYPLILLISVIVGIGYYYLLIVLGSKFPLFNTIASLLCILATYFASKFYIEQWIYWVGYAAISITIWLLDFKNASNGALVYLVMSICFMIINISGIVTWIKNYKIQKVEN